MPNTITGARLTPKKLAAQFNTTSTTLANVTGFTYDVLAGKTYIFRMVANGSLDAAGGEKWTVGGTCTATSIHWRLIGITNVATFAHLTVATALGTASQNTGYTASYLVLEGTITVNAAGTLTIQFAQSVANGTSSILAGASFEVYEASNG